MLSRVRAHNTAKESENKIHDDHVAIAYGFRGGLVPGVAVYGYMIPPVLECFGRGWLERGAMSLRLLAPQLLLATGPDNTGHAADHQSEPELEGPEWHHCVSGRRTLLF